MYKKIICLVLFFTVTLTQYAAKNKLNLVDSKHKITEENVAVKKKGLSLDKS